MAVALVVGAGQIESGRVAQSQAQTAPITIAPQNLTSNNLGTFVSSDYTPLANVARDWWPYARTAVYGRNTVPRDDRGVAMAVIRGKLYDHPVSQAQDGINALESDRVRADPANLKLALADAQRLVDRRVESRGAWFFPYGFDFAIDTAGLEVMRAPWYSAMAQGQALTLFVRLFELTGDTSWREAADATFDSLLLPQSDNAVPYVSFIDSSKHLWLEEYPRHPSEDSDQVYNGTMFALFGVWDYARLTGDARAIQIFRGSAATVRHYAYLFFRVPFWTSKYCLRHGKGGAKYHQIVVDEMITMHAITANPDFAQVADRYRDDYPLTPMAASVSLAAGSVYGYRFRSNGAVVSTKRISLSQRSSAPASQRARIKGRGYYYLITAGSLAGYMVQERTGIASANVLAVPTRYAHRRSFQIAQGRTVTGYIVNERTAERSVPRAISFPSASRAAFDRSAWIDGAPWLHVVNGSFAGRWIPQAQVTVS